MRRHSVLNDHGSFLVNRNVEPPPGPRGGSLHRADEAEPRWVAMKDLGKAGCLRVRTG